MSLRRSITILFQFNNSFKPNSYTSIRNYNYLIILHLKLKNNDIDSFLLKVNQMIYFYYENKSFVSKRYISYYWLINFLRKENHNI